jgi:hypothetical protein
MTLQETRVLPPVVRQIDLSFSPGYGVNIDDEVRAFRISEGITLPTRVKDQAVAFGEEMVKVFDLFAVRVADASFRERIGITDQIYKERIEPFLKIEDQLVFFGADAVVDNKGNLRFIEINPQPQALGLFDNVMTRLNPDGSQNNLISPTLKDILHSELKNGEIGVVITHPANAFHQYHLSLADQIGFRTSSVQELNVDDELKIVSGGQTVGILFRECSMATLTDPKITDPRILRSILKGKTKMVNGPLSPYLGDRAFFAEISKMVPGIEDFFPNMRVIRLEDEVDFNMFPNWWLKGETRGNLEMTIQLNNKNRNGWIGAVITDIVKGDFESALGIIEGKSSTTASRLRKYVIGIRDSGSKKFLLQEHIESEQIQIEKDDGEIQSLRTVLRAYYVVGRQRTGTNKTFIEILASRNPKVNMAGYAIPVLGVVDS